jgi:hypothetical protein
VSAQAAVKEDAPATPSTREETATRLLDVLTREPQSEAALRRAIFGNAARATGGSEITASGLRALEARHLAKRIPHSAGTRQGGWTLYDSAHETLLAAPHSIEFPYEFGVLALDQMFVDGDYQRPLTTFAKRIESRFDPVLFGTLTLSDRGTKHKPRRYALIDGQTRWQAATRLGIQHAPAVIFKGLSVADEATIFWRLQKERRSVTSWHRFRAQLAGGNEESLAIKEMAQACGYQIGDGPGKLNAVAALEACFRTDEFQLERALIDLRDAWPERTPEGSVIKGLHFFFRHFPLEQRVKKDVDDERLVSRLRVAGPDGLARKANAARESALKGGSHERWVATAIQNYYLSGGKS